MNFAQVIFNGDKSQNIRVYDGDFIRIKKAKDNVTQLSLATKSNLNPRFINVFVSGRVQNPGNKTVSRSSTLNDAIDISGGPKVLKGKMRFIRFNNDGNIDVRKIKYSQNHKRGTYKNPYLRDGDIIIIDNSFISSSNEVLTEITRPFTGIFSTYGLIKALQD